MTFNLKEKNGISYLVGDKKVFNKSTIPYDSKMCEFLGEFSKELMKNKNSNKYPHKHNHVIIAVKVQSSLQLHL